MTTFWARSGNLGKSPLHPQNFACSYIYGIYNLVKAVFQSTLLHAKLL